jgi:hypothetical protein
MMPRAVDEPVRCGRAGASDLYAEPTNKSETRVLRTPALLWFGPPGSRQQVRCAIQQDGEGRLSLSVSQWAPHPDGWHPVHGISVWNLRELAALIFGLVKAWLALASK